MCRGRVSPGSEPRAAIHASVLLPRPPPLPQFAADQAGDVSGQFCAGFLELLSNPLQVKLPIGDQDGSLFILEHRVLLPVVDCQVAETMPAASMASAAAGRGAITVPDGPRDFPGTIKLAAQDPDRVAAIFDGLAAIFG